MCPQLELPLLSVALLAQSLLCPPGSGLLLWLLCLLPAVPVHQATAGPVPGQSRAGASPGLISFQEALFSVSHLELQAASFLPSLEAVLERIRMASPALHISSSACSSAAISGSEREAVPQMGLYVPGGAWACWVLPGWAALARCSPSLSICWGSPKPGGDFHVFISIDEGTILAEAAGVTSSALFPHSPLPSPPLLMGFLFRPTLLPQGEDIACLLCLTGYT